MFQICRTCLKEISDLNFFTLTNNNSTVSIIIKQQLALCIPEMDLDTIPDPVMCQACITSLHSAYVFKYKCLQNEERIRTFLQSKKRHSSSNSNSTSIRLQEMFINLCADALTKDTQVVQHVDTFVDSSHQTIIDNHDNSSRNREDNFIEHLHDGNIDCLNSNEEAIFEGLCSLQRLSSTEELQLEFNCMLIEQSHLENESSSSSNYHLDTWNNLHLLESGSTNNYNLDSWNNFEKRYSTLFYSEGASYIEHDCQDNNCQYCQISSSSNTAWLYTEKNTTAPKADYQKSAPLLFRPGVKENQTRNSIRQFLRKGVEKFSSRHQKDYECNAHKVKRPRVIPTVKCKIKHTLKKPKTRKVAKIVKPSQSKNNNNIFKCLECDYKTKTKINLELHIISHIKLDEYDLEMNE